MHGAADRGTVAAMPIPDFTQAAGAPSPASPSPVVAQTVANLFANDGTPPYEPAAIRVPFELGDGLGQTIDTDLVPQGLMPDEDRSFELRQLTVAETCRAHRFARIGERFDINKYVQLYVRFGVRKVGQKFGPALGDQELDRWFDQLGIHGFAVVKMLADKLCDVRDHEAKSFAASKRDDILNRRFKRTLSGSVVPRKRWAARVGIQAHWVETFAEEDAKAKAKRLAEGRQRTVLGGQWTVGDNIADEGQILLCTRDLSFTMKEMTVSETAQAADFVEDPEDVYAIRIMAAMMAVTEVGGMALGNDMEGLVKKLQWMDDIGPRGRQQVTGLYAQLHEVDPVKTASFLETARTLD